MENLDMDIEVSNNQDVKILSCQCDVFYLDDVLLPVQKISFSKCAMIFENPVKVLNTSGDLIGVANLEVNRSVVSASLYIDYHTPERLNIETKETKMYPHLMGYYDTYVDGPILNRVSKYYVESIILSLAKHYDSRITHVE